MKTVYRLLFIFLLLISTRANLFAAANIQRCDADGSLNPSGNHYAIQTADDLIWLSSQSDLTNGEATFTSLATKWSANYVQPANIDFGEDETQVDWDGDGAVDGTSTSGFSPIGDITTKFTGNYNGDGHTISNLFINRPSHEDVGLFGYCSSATIHTIGLEDVNITGYRHVGGLIGSFHSYSVNNCYITGSVSGFSYVGGLIGSSTSSTSSVNNCYSTGSVSGNYYVGGLIGYSFYFSSSVNNSFWNTETSGQITSAGGSGKATGQMKEYATYAAAGWDFQEETVNGTDDIWGYSPNENNGYPFLKWQGYTHNTQNVPCSVSTQGVSDITSTSFTVSCYITNPNNTSIEQCGVCWNTTGLPSINDNMAEEDEIASHGSFTLSITNVSSSTMYYVRAYATTNGKTIYGETLAFYSRFDGNGDNVAPFQISSVVDLLFLSQHSEYWDKHFIQTANITFNTDETQVDWNGDGAADGTGTSGFSPIGNGTVEFNGSYNGDGHTITNLYIHRTDQNYVGLFGYCNSATISKIGMEDENISGNYYVGGLVSSSSFSSVNNCYSTGSVSGNDNIGGLVGYSSYSSVNNCYSTGSVSGNKSSVGGLIGFSSYTSSVNNCYSTGSVSGNSYVGGLVGSSTDYYTVNNSFWNTETSGQSISAGGSGKTTAQMNDYITYEAAGWDFQVETVNGDQGIWGFNTSENSGYPFLKWQGYTHNVPFRVSTLDITNITGSAGTASCYITNPDNTTVQQHGVCWNTTGSPTTEDNKTEEGTISNSGSFTSSITGLTNFTKYYVRAYAIKSSETLYGETMEFCSSFDGAGTKEVPFKISSVADLIFLSQHSEYWDKHFIQTANIVFVTDETQVDWNGDGAVDTNDSEGFSPIGNGTVQFTGSYKGNGHTINNLFINRSDQDHIGMFGWSRIQELSNLGLVNCNIIGGGNNTGGLIGVNTGDAGLVKSCFVIGTVTGNGHELGGFIGDLQGEISIENCYAYATVIDQSGSVNIGSFVGLVSGTSTIKNCYVAASVSSGGSDVGAFVGKKSSGSILNCFYDSELGSPLIDNDATALSSSDFAMPSNFTNWVFDENTDAVWFMGKDVDDKIRPILQWSAHPITYNLNGASNSSENPNYYTGNGVINLIQPIKDGNMHRYWYTTDELQPTDAIDANTHNDITLNAKYYNVWGSGTIDQPYQISSAEELIYLSQDSELWSSNFIQTADIDFGTDETLVDWNGDEIAGNDNLGFSPIGTGTIQFRGSYNGDGHTISNLYINRPNQDHIGLFGWAKTTGISNLGLVDIDITGRQNVGGLIGVNYGGYEGEIENCFVVGNITYSGDDIGGFIGDINEKLIIKNCYSNVSITGNNGYNNTGGFIGYVHDSGSTLIENCYASASVSSSGGSNINAFIGNLESGTTSNCYYDSDIAGTLTDSLASPLTTSDFATQSNFTSWAFDSTTDAAWYIGKDVDDKIRPILQWSAHSITYNLDGGINNSKNPNYYTGDGAIQLFNAESSNKIFFGWFSQSDLASENKISSIASGEEDINVWAKYVDIFSGSGANDDPYQIATVSDLIQLSNLPQIWDKCFIQTADIDFGSDENQVDWNGDGTVNANDSDGFSPIGGDPVQFEGSYRGNGHTISSLYINRPNQDHIGLFGWAKTTGISNLGLVDIDIVGRQNVGGLIGVNYGGYEGEIENCFVVGNITCSGNDIGGFIGDINEKLIIKNCYSNVSITGNNGYNNTGGFIGYVHDSGSTLIENCYASASVSSSGGSNINAFIGNLESGTTSNCYYDSDIAGTLTDSLASPLTTSEFAIQSNFTSWDFIQETTNGSDDIWSINPTANGGYPFLSWQGYTHVGENSNYNIWKGGVSSAETAWDNASNWSKETVPTVNDDVLISGADNMPVISASTFGQCNNLIIDEGASLAITSHSTQSGSLQIGGTVSGEGANNVSYHRHMGTSKFQLVSTPVQGQDIGEFYTDNMANIKTNGSLIAIAPYCNSYVDPCWEFYTTDAGSNKASAAGDFVMGQGYEMLARGNNTGTEQDPVYTADATLTFTGKPYTGNVDFLVTDGTTQGSAWNLIGNPYTTALCVNVQGDQNAEEHSLLHINRSNLDGDHCAIYVWDNAADEYITVNESSNFNVAPGQAFFICDKVGNANINFTTAMRTGDVALDFKSAKSLQPELKLVVSDGSTNHSTRIVLNDNCTASMDRGWDAGCMPLSNKSLMAYTQLVSEESDLKLSIQAISTLSRETTVPVGITATAGSEFSIGIEQQNIAEGTEIILEDRELGTFTDLSGTDTRSCTPTVGSNDISGFGRFYLHLKNSTTPVDQMHLNITAIPFYREKLIRIKGISPDAISEISLYTIDGRAVKTEITPEQNTISMTNMHRGIYLVVVKTTYSQSMKKVMWK